MTLPWWKSLTLSLYYHGTRPVRWRRNARLAARGRSPVMVLFGHRIADDRANEWTTPLAVFRRQIAWLKRNFDLVSLAEAHQRLASGRNDRPCVSLTFDDGYADNCRGALPLLVELGVPVTYFVASGHVLTGEPFTHDVALGRPLAVNTPAEIRQWADAGVEIGAHTRWHVDLGPVEDEAVLVDEIVGSQQDLQMLTGRPVRFFAFPFGQWANLSAPAFAVLRRAGFVAACSAYGGYNFPGDDPFHLQRIHLDDDLVRLKNWTTLDPRKLRCTERWSNGAVVADGQSGINNIHRAPAAATRSAEPVGA